MTSKLKVNLINDAGDNNIITSDGSGSVTLGAAFPAVGKIGQVIQSQTTSYGSVTATSWTKIHTDFDTSITPSATSSKVLVTITGGIYPNNGHLTIYRGGSNLLTDKGFLRMYTNNDTGITASYSYLDSPNTTSATTYSWYVKMISGTFYYNNDVTTGTMTLMEVLA